MIRGMKTWRNFQMRYASRTIRIPIAWMHERFARGDIRLRYELSARMAADVYTKAFVDADKWRVATWLLGVSDPKIYDEAAKHALQESEEPELPAEPDDDVDVASVAAGGGAAVSASRTSSKS